MLNASGGILWLRQGVLCFVTEVLWGDSRFTDRTHRCIYIHAHDPGFSYVHAITRVALCLEGAHARGREASGLLQRHTTAQAVPV
jgi:hypothetical protein